MKSITSCCRYGWLLVIAFWACDRTVDFIPPSDTVDLPSEIFQTNEVIISEFQVVAEFGDTLELEDSTSYAPTILILPENLCVYGNGAPCEGDLDVQLIQAFTKSDMIFSNIPTTSKKAPLESGGAFYLNITQGGEQLYVRPDAQFKIQAPVARTSGSVDKMKFYQLEEIATEVFDWRLKGPLTNIGEEYYTIAFNELDRWMNIDYEIATALQEFTVNLTLEGAPVSDAEVFYALNDFNSVAKADFQQGLSSYQGFVPLGSTLQVVALKKDGDQWYWSNTPVAGSENDLELELEPVAYEIMVTALKKL